MALRNGKEARQEETIMPPYKTQHYVLRRIDKELDDLIVGIGDPNIREASKKLARNYKNAISILRNNRGLMCFTLTAATVYGMAYMIFMVVIALC